MLLVTYFIDLIFSKKGFKTSIKSKITILHNMFSFYLFQISVVIYLLYVNLGISAVIGSIVCIVIMTPLQFLIGNAMSKNGEVIAVSTQS